MNIKQKLKIIIPIVILLAIISFIIYFLNRKTDNNELTLYGNIEIRQVDLSFQASGQILKLLKEEGDSVRKGELVALLDSRDYVANYNKAIAGVEQTQALKTENQLIFNRNSNLVGSGAVSKQTYDTSKNMYDKSSADYKSALANRQFTKNQLDYTRLYAPDNGIIMTRVQEPGATVQKGQTVYTMSKNKPVWIRAYVNETDLGNIKYGQKVRVLTDTVNPKTGKNREYQGQIGYISPVAEFTPKTVQSTDLRTNLVYRIRVYVDNIDEYLRQGMPTTIKIDLLSESK